MIFSNLILNERRSVLHFIKKYKSLFKEKKTDEIKMTILGIFYIFSILNLGSHFKIIDLYKLI